MEDMHGFNIEKHKEINIEKYKAFIDMEHPTSGKHPRMSFAARAAQFSPFAALTGYDAAIKEEERLTADKVELDEAEKAKLDEKMGLIQQNLSKKPIVNIEYFVRDEKKQGGCYVREEGIIRKINIFERKIFMEKGTIIPIDDISDIDITSKIP